MILNDADNVMLGSLQVEKVMLGSTEVWLKDGNIVKNCSMEWGGFYNVNYPDSQMRGQPVPSSDTTWYSQRYIRDLTYYPIREGTETLYGYVNNPITIDQSLGYQETLIYLYQYDKDKNFVAQTWSSGGEFNNNGAPIDIVEGARFFRFCYGKSRYNDAALPIISSPADFNDGFIISYYPII